MATGCVQLLGQLSALRVIAAHTDGAPIQHLCRDRIVFATRRAAPANLCNQHTADRAATNTATV